MADRGSRRSGRVTHVVWMVLLLACPGLVFSQTATPGFRYTIATKPDAYGLYSVSITNLSKVPITAIHAFRSCIGVEGVSQESGSTGSDSLLYFVFARPTAIPFLARSVIPAGANIQLDMPLLDPKCPKGVSVLFEDGHGEGSEEPEYGWQQMINDRYSSYAELLRTRGVVESMTGATNDFAASLLQILDERRLAVSNPHVRDVPSTEVRSRDFVLGVLLQHLREPDRVPTELKSRETTLRLLDEWMEPLKRGGYDKPPVKMRLRNGDHIADVIGSSWPGYLIGGCAEAGVEAGEVEASKMGYRGSF